MNHGSRDVECGVALILQTVHVLQRVSRQGVDQNTRGVGIGHILHLHETKTTSINHRWCFKTSRGERRKVHRRTGDQQKDFVNISTILSHFIAVSLEKYEAIKEIIASIGQILKKNVTESK